MEHLTNLHQDGHLIYETSPFLTNTGKRELMGIEMNNDVLQLVFINKLIITAPLPRYNEEKYKKLYSSKLVEALKREKIERENPVDYFRSLDPTERGEFTEYLIKSYIGGSIKRVEDISSRIIPALQDYLILLNNKVLSTGESGKPWTNETDLNNYLGITKKGKTQPGIEDLIEKYSERLSELKGVKQQKIVAKEGGEVVFENEYATVIHPTTEESACYYGQGTRWCTAANKDNMFKEYNQQGPLYIIIPKNPSYQGEKYQMHEKSKSFMNEKDKPVDRLQTIKKLHLIDFKPVSKILVFGNIDEIKYLIENGYNLENSEIDYLIKNEKLDIIKYLINSEIKFTEEQKNKMLSTTADGILWLIQNNYTLPDGFKHYKFNEDDYDYDTFKKIINTNYRLTENDINILFTVFPSISLLKLLLEKNYTLSEENVFEFFIVYSDENAMEFLNIIPHLTLNMVKTILSKSPSIEVTEMIKKKGYPKEAEDYIKSEKERLERIKNNRKKMGGYKGGYKKR